MMKKLAQLLFAVMLLSVPAYSAATLDRAVCSTADASGGASSACSAQELIDSATQEIVAVDGRAPYPLTSVSGTNTITASVTPTLTAYANGNTFYLKPANTITGSATLNINTVGAKSLVSVAGSALASGDLRSDTIYLVMYFSTSDHFRVLTPLGSGVASASADLVTIANSAGLTAERALTAGTALDLSDGGANSTVTMSFDSTEVGNTTWGSGSGSTWTFDAGATDATLAFATPATITMAGSNTSPILNLDDQGTLRFLEEDAGGSNYLGLVAPSAITSDVTCTLENDSHSIPDSCVGDGSDANTLGSDGDKGDITVGGTGTTLTIDADSVALTTDTTGNYVATVADGTGVDGTASGEGTTYTPTLDLTELSTFTLGAGAATGIIFDAGATDPAIETASGTFTIDIGGTNETTLTASAFSPGVNDGSALGETTTPLRWSDLFMADGSVINMGTTTSKATITHDAATDSIAIAADPDNATATSVINLQVDGGTEASLNATNFSPGANDGNALGVSGTAWADLFLATGGLIEMDGGTTNSLTCTGGSCTIEGNTMYRAGGIDVPVADGGTGASSLADLITLTTHTSGNYVATVADGTGIDGTASGEGTTYTPTLDLTEVNSTTFGSGTFTTMTFDAGATDPVLTMATGASVTLSGGGTSPILGLDDQGALRFLEEDAGGSNYVAFVAPSALTSNVTITLENDSNPIPDSAVGDGTDDDIPDAGEVDDSALAASAVDGGTGGEIEDGTLTAADLGTDSVSADELNATGVESELEAVMDLPDMQGQISDAQIAAGAVDGGAAGEIADNSLTTDDLGTGSVGSDEIATDAVGSDEIATAAVGAAEAAALDAGDITTGTFAAALIGSNTVDLTTDTVGDYTATVADGTGIDGTATGEGSTYTPTLDLTEINSATWGSGTFTTFTFDAGAVDPALTMGSGTAMLEAVTSIRQADAANDGGALRFLEDPGTGSNYVEFKAPADITANVSCVLENDGHPIPDSCVGDGSDSGGSLSDADYGDITVSGTGTVFNIDAGTVGATEAAALDAGDVTTGTFAAALIGNNTVDLTTDTVGNYVLDVADGTGIDGTAAGEGATYTPTLDLTEISSATWGAGSFTAFTFDAGAVDPVLTFGSGTLDFSALVTVGLDDEAELRFFEEDAGGSNYVGFKAPAALTSNVTCTFENDGHPIPDSCVGDGIDAGAAGGIANLVEDTDAQFGGNIDANTFSLLFDDNTGLRDESNNEQLVLQTTASAVNQWEITNSATGGVQKLQAAGDDAAIAVTLASKSTDPVNLEINGNTELTVDATSTSPGANDGNALGTTALQWSDLFLAEGAVINWDNGDATMTQSGNDITVAGISTFGLGTSTTVTHGNLELGSASDTTISRSAAGVIAVEGIPLRSTESFCVAASDETTALTTGTAKVTFRMPYAFTLTGIRGSINTVSSSGAPVVDVNEAGSTIMTTNKVLIDVSEKTSTTAATAPTLTDTSLADDAEMTIDIDTAGTGAKGLKICLIGYQT